MPHANEHLTNGIEGGVYATAAPTGTASAVTLAAAPVSTYQFYMTDVIITQSGTALLTVTLTAASGVSFIVDVAANGGGCAHAFRKPFKFGAGTLTYTLSAAPTLGTVHITVCGFWLPVPNTN